MKLNQCLVSPILHDLRVEVLVREERDEVE
jgi:hypothetical protein